MAQGVNMVMTVIGFIVSTMFIVFVCTRLICARIHYLSSRRSSRLSSRSDLSALERGLRGVEPLVVSNFPTKKYNDPFFSCSVDAQCTVCLSEFHSEDTLRILPFCGHFFHSTCIDIWLQQHCTCPICRVSLRELAYRDHWVRPMSSPAAQYSSDGPDHLVTRTIFADHVQSTDNEPSSVLNEGGRVTNYSSNSPSNA